MGLIFSGSSEYLQTVSTITPPSTSTVCVWVIFNSVTGTQRIWGSADNFEWRCEGSILYNDTGVSGGYGVGSTTLFGTGTLYHIVTTNNITTGSAAIYVNGVSDNTGTGQTSVPGTATLTIANRTGSSNYFSGVLEDLRFYNRVLSSDEIATLYTCKGSDFIVDGLIYRWLMNEGAPGVTASGTSVIKDLVGSVNCTPTNTPTWDVVRTKRRMVA